MVYENLTKLKNKIDKFDKNELFVLFNLYEFSVLFVFCVLKYYPSAGCSTISLGDDNPVMICTCSLVRVSTAI